MLQLTARYLFSAKVPRMGVGGSGRRLQAASLHQAGSTEQVIETRRKHDVLMSKVYFGVMPKRLCLEHVTASASSPCWPESSCRKSAATQKSPGSRVRAWL